MQLGNNSDIDEDEEIGDADAAVGDSNENKVIRNEQLDQVRSNLRDRLNRGINRVMECMRIAEDKELLADNALSLLSEKLNGSLHVAKPSPCESSMRTITTRTTNVNMGGNGAPAEMEMDIDINMHGNTNGNTSANGSEIGNASSFRIDQDTGFEILQAPTVSQTLDASQRYLNVCVSGVVARHLFSDSDASSFILRLNTTVAVPISMCWEVSSTTATRPDEPVTLSARTPWAGILSSVSSGDGKLFIHLSVQIISVDNNYNYIHNNNNNNQDLGHISLLTPALLLQKHALKRDLPTEVSWPRETECIIAECIDGIDSNIDISEQTKSLLSKADGAICDVQSRVIHGTTLSKIHLTAPNLLMLTAYINALRLSLPDGVTLRSFATGGNALQLLESWLRCLRKETKEFRAAAGKNCMRGFDGAKIAHLMRLQIETEEANGRCKEAININNL